jgi:hypothetical protein
VLLELSLKNLSIDWQLVFANLLMKLLVLLQFLFTPQITHFAWVCVFSVDHFVARSCLTSLQSIYKLFPHCQIVFQKWQPQHIREAENLGTSKWHCLDFIWSIINHIYPFLSHFDLIVKNLKSSAWFEMDRGPKIKFKWLCIKSFIAL